jgi:hypothetical protein
LPNREFLLLQGRCEVCFPSTPGKPEILNQSDLFLDLVQFTGGFDAESMKAFFLREESMKAFEELRDLNLVSSKLYSRRREYIDQFLIMYIQGLVQL